VNPPGILDAFLVKARSDPEMREADVAGGRHHAQPPGICGRNRTTTSCDTSEGIQRFWAGISRI